jgi:hypothetical protein
MMMMTAMTTAAAPQPNKLFTTSNSSPVTAASSSSSTPIALLAAEIISRGTPNDAKNFADCESVAEKIAKILSSLKTEVSKTENKQSEFTFLSSMLFPSATPKWILDFPDESPPTTIETLLFGLLSYAARFSPVSNEPEHCFAGIGLNDLNFIVRRFEKYFATSWKLKAAVLFLWCHSPLLNSHEHENFSTFLQHWYSLWDFEHATSLPHFFRAISWAADALTPLVTKLTVQSGKRERKQVDVLPLINRPKKMKLEILFKILLSRKQELFLHNNNINVPVAELYSPQCTLLRAQKTKSVENLLGAAMLHCDDDDCDDDDDDVVATRSQNGLMGDCQRS